MSLLGCIDRMPQVLEVADREEPANFGVAEVLVVILTWRGCRSKFLLQKKSLEFIELGRIGLERHWHPLPY